MKITIKTVKGAKHNIDCEPGTLIAEIKKKIQEELQVDPENQKLIFKGKHLDDSKTLSDLSIKDNDCFVLMILKKKTIKKKLKPSPKKIQESPQPQQQIPNTPDNPLQNPNPAPPQPDAPQLPQNQTAQQQELDPNNEIVQGHAHKQALIAELLEMGFERPKIEQALVAAYYNKEMAIQYLLNGIPEYILNEQAQPQANPNQIQVTQAQMQQLQQMASSPAFRLLRQQAQSNPQVLPQFLTILQQQNPSLYQLFSQNPQLLATLLSAPPQGQQQQPQQQPQQTPQFNPPQPQTPQQQPQFNPPQPQQPQHPQQPQQPLPQQAPQPPQNLIELSEEDNQAIQNLQTFGFSQQQCIEAYLVCNKNSDLAISYLFDMKEQEQNPNP